MRQHPLIRCAALFGCVLAAATTLHAGKSIVVPAERIRTIGQAMAKAGPGDTVWVEPGVYSEHVVLNPGVALKSRQLHKAIIDGKARGNVVTLAKRATISGFVIRNGTVGVISKNANTAITNCKIINNRLTGIINVRNLAKIEDNIIVFNGASGIQTYNVSVSTGTINHNTIAYNANHGIALGRNSPVVIQNNIIAFNERFGISAESGQKGVRIIGNDVFGNIIGSPPPPAENVVIDPVFSSPRFNSDFTVTSDMLKNFKGQDNETPGVRLIY